VNRLFGASAQDAPLNLKKLTITSSSAISCTQVGIAGQGTAINIINTGPAFTSTYLQLYDDIQCTVPANVIYGDFSSILLPNGQTPLNVPISTALSYRLSGALPSTQNIILTFTGLGF
jgi:hypothetical protein